MLGMTPDVPGTSAQTSEIKNCPLGDHCVTPILWPLNSFDSGVSWRMNSDFHLPVMKCSSSSSGERCLDGGLPSSSTTCEVAASTGETRRAKMNARIDLTKPKISDRWRGRVWLQVECGSHR